MPAKKKTKAKTKRPAPAAKGNQNTPLAQTLGALAAAFAIRFGRSAWALLVRITPPKERWQAWSKSPKVRKCGGVAAGFAVMVLALGIMKGRLSAQERFQLDPARIELAAGELSWVSGESAARMEAVIQGDLRDSLGELSVSDAFDDEFLGSIAATLEDNPWVASVERIERYYPSEEANARLAVNMSIRKPVLMVEYGNRLLFVDRDGVVLPYPMALDGSGMPEGPADKIMLRDELTRPLRRVVGMYGVRGREPVAGEVWKNEQIVAALSVEKDLRQEGVDESLTEAGYGTISQIDVSDIEPVLNEYHKAAYAAGGGIRLKLSFSDAEVVWGKAPVHGSTLEATSTQKIQHFAELLGADPELKLQDSYFLNRLPTQG